MNKFVTVSTSRFIIIISLFQYEMHKHFKNNTLKMENSKRISKFNSATPVILYISILYHITFHFNHFMLYSESLPKGYFK